MHATNEREEKTDYIPNWQKRLALKEKEALKQGSSDLKNWNEIKNDFKFLS